MNFFGKALLSKSTQPLSPDRLATVRGMTNLVMTAKEGSVYKGCEMDDYVRRPEFVVQRLKQAGLLPKGCYVERVQLPGVKTLKSALFEVRFQDLAKRQQAIADYVDTQGIDPDARDVSPVTGEDTVKLLSEMLAHAHVHRPELIANDALLQGICMAIAHPPVYKALVSGAAEGFTSMINALRGSAQ
jgi:hypothetical protein